MKKFVPTPHAQIALSISPSYLRVAFDPIAREEKLAQVMKALTKHSAEFDAIAVRGLSGVIMGTLVADKLSKGLIVVRKPEENSHGMGIEGAVGLHRYIVFDDFVASGSTVDSIVTELRQRAMPEPVACYFWGDTSSATMLHCRGLLFPVWSEPDVVVPKRTPVYQQPRYLGTLSAEPLSMEQVKFIPAEETPR